MGNSQSCLNLEGLPADDPSSLSENRMLLTPSLHFHIKIYYNTESKKVKTFFHAGHDKRMNVFHN